MLKRCLSSLILAACLLMMLPLAARADVLVEPNNDFYFRHSNECASLNRSFYANGESGSVALKEEPGSKNEIATLENGEVLHIMFTYNHNGEIWGVTELYTPDKPYGQWPTGWIPMKELLLVYDYASFAEEHQNEFHSYAGGYEELKAADKIVLWSWPCSGGQQGTLEAEIDENFSVTHAYTDGQGREWGFVGYWYGYRNAWICMSDPANDNIPAFNPPPQPEFWQPSDTNIPQSGFPTTLLIIILVAVLVAGTAVLIRVFWKPNKGDK